MIGEHPVVVVVGVGRDVDAAIVIAHHFKTVADEVVGVGGDEVDRRVVVGGVRLLHEAVGRVVLPLDQRDEVLGLADEIAGEHLLDARPAAVEVERVLEARKRLGRRAVELEVGQ